MPIRSASLARGHILGHGALVLVVIVLVLVVLRTATGWRWCS
jgi:hypothetical protein